MSGVLGLTSFTVCSRCGAGVSLAQVWKTSVVENRYVVCYFACGGCGLKERMALEMSRFGELKNEFAARLDDRERVVSVFAFDLEGVDSVEDFLLYCGDLGRAPVEYAGRCRCGRCGR